MDTYVGLLKFPHPQSDRADRYRSAQAFFFMTEGIKLSLTHTMKLYQISFGRVYAVVRTYSRKIPKDIQPCSPRWNSEDTFSLAFQSKRLLHLSSPQSSLFRDRNCWAVSQPFSLGAVEDVSSTDNDVHANPTAKYSETSVEKGKHMFASQARIMLVRSCRKKEGRKENIRQPFHNNSIFHPCEPKKKNIYLDLNCIENSQKKRCALDKCVHEEDGNHKVWCINNKQTFFSFSLFLINLPQIDWKSKRAHDRFL